MQGNAHGRRGAGRFICLSPEIGIYVDLVDLAGFSETLVKTQIVLYVQGNEDHAQDSYRKSGNIYPAVDLAADQVPPGYFQVIKQHSEGFVRPLPRISMPKLQAIIYQSLGLPVPKGIALFHNKGCPVLIQSLPGVPD